MLVVEIKMKSSTSLLSPKRAFSSFAERKSAKKFGGMLQIFAIKSAMLFTSAIARSYARLAREIAQIGPLPSI